MDGTLPLPTADDNPKMQAALSWFEACMWRVRTSGKFAEFVSLTPEIASVLLARNAGNRYLVATGVRDWSAALRNGDWEVNGEPIIVSDTGELNDGQHRCQAVFETGIPMATLIVFGVSRGSRKTVDTGRKRTAGHILGMEGVQNGKSVAAALSALLNLQAGISLATHHAPKEIERALALHPGIIEETAVANRAAGQFRQSRGLFCALCYLMAKSDAVMAAAFFTMLGDGTAPSKNHPVARLRERLTDNLATKAKLPNVEVAALVIKAWNAYREGRTLTYLRWRTGGDTPEAFPSVR